MYVLFCCAIILAALVRRFQIHVTSNLRWFMCIVSAGDKSGVCEPFHLKKQLVPRSQRNLWGLKTHRCQSKWNYHADIYLICTHNPEIQGKRFLAKRYCDSSIKSFNLWKYFLFFFCITCATMLPIWWWYCIVYSAFIIHIHSDE